MSSNHRGTLTKVAIHQSLVRPMLFMGGERTLVILSMMFAGYLGYMITMRFGIWWGVPIGLIIWFTLIYLLRRMAVADPFMWPVLQRARLYKPFYPARGRFDASSPMYKEFK